MSSTAHPRFLCAPRFGMLAGWLAWIGLSESALAALINISGGLPRDLTADCFPLTVSITGITDEELTRGAQDADTFASRLSLKFPDVDGNPIKFTPEEAAVLTNVKFYAQLDGVVEETQTDVNNHSLGYPVRICEAETGELQEQADLGKIKRIAIAFSLGGTQLGEERTFTLEQETYVIDAAPGFESTAIIGTNRALRVQWQTVEQVATKGKDGASTVKPTGISVFLIARDAATTLELPSKTFTPAASSDVTANPGCTYTAPASETDVTACISCPADTYLVDEEMAQRGFLVKSRVRVSDGGTTFTGLENDKDYVAFMMYEPDGIQRSSCVSGRPTPNLSLTELNGEKEAKLTDFSCFIATAAYGTPLHQDLSLFRHFRDDSLMKTPFGRAFVRLYYEYSPPVADVIAAHAGLRSVTRGLLEVVAEVLRTFYDNDKHLVTSNP